MDKIFLNELSLNGQYKSIEDFAESAMPVIKCLQFIRKQGIPVQKHTSFYEQHITPEGTWNELRGARGDRIRKIKSLLLSTTDHPPYWDQEIEACCQDFNSVYTCEEEDVSATSVAEAAECHGTLLSFPNSKYSDRELRVLKDEKKLSDLASATEPAFLFRYLWLDGQIDLTTYLQQRYSGTRLDFSNLEASYGFEEFEKTEIVDCVNTFERFVAHESWESLLADSALCYKSYSPSQKKYDWFAESAYRDFSIDKFRCGNPKRCFGYREKDVFYVLRMDRTHKISDHG